MKYTLHAAETILQGLAGKTITAVTINKLSSLTLHFDDETLVIHGAAHGDAWLEIETIETPDMAKRLLFKAMLYRGKTALLDNAIVEYPPDATVPPRAVILNDMPFEEAFEIFVAKANR
jgi:hypothetical protein